MNPFETKPLSLTYRLAPRLKDVLGVDRLYAARIRGGYPYTKCYWNAAEAAKALGGTMVLGWKFEVVNGAILQIVHHALVKLDTKLVCVTDPSSDYKSRSMTFAPSEKFPLSDGFPPCIPSYFIGLKHGIDTKELNSVHKRMIAKKLQAVEIARASKGTFLHGEVLIPLDQVEARAEFTLLEKEIIALGKLEDQIYRTLLKIK